MDFAQRARYLVEQENYNEAVSLLGQPGIEQESQNSRFMLYIGVALLGLKQESEGLGAIFSSLQQRPEDIALLDELPNTVQAAISVQKIKAAVAREGSAEKGEFGEALSPGTRFYLGLRDWVLGTALMFVLAFLIYEAISALR